MDFVEEKEGGGSLIKFPRESEPDPAANESVMKLWNASLGVEQEPLLLLFLFLLSGCLLAPRAETEAEAETVGEAEALGEKHCIMEKQDCVFHQQATG